MVTADELMTELSRGLFHPLGAILFSNETYRQSLPIIDASGLTSMEFGHTTKNWYYDYKTGHVKRSTASLSELTKNHLFKAEIDRYIHFWTTEFAPLASIGYKVHIHKNFLTDILIYFLTTGWCRRVYDVYLALAA